MTSRLFAALAIAVVAAGCSEDPIAPPAFACTAVAYPAVAVSVLDSVTGLGISAGSTIVVRDGAFVDSLVVSSASTALNDAFLHPFNVFERPGTYTITVRRAGYRPWTQSGISVTRSACHVNTARVTARMQPLP